MHLNERGMVSMKVIFWVLLLFVVLHIGFKLIPMYMDAWKIEDEIQGKAYMAQEAKFTDQELKSALSSYAKSLDVPLQPEDIDVTRNEATRQLTLHTDWNVEVKFFWGACGATCIKTYHFDIVKEGKY